MVERNVILDCDTGEDDALAILVALQSKLPLRYIVTSHGNTTIENSTTNTSRVLSQVGFLDIKVVRGSPKPLEQHPHHKVGEIETASALIGKNGLCGLELPASKINNIISPDQNKFSNFLSDLIKSQAPTDYIITGPSTNFAKACEALGTSIKDYVRGVYIMGGALFIPGNSGKINPETGKEYSEFNFYCDPIAINIVLNSGLPIYLITWDETSTLTIPKNLTRDFKTETAISKLSAALIKHFYLNLKRNPNQNLGRNFELNDPITIMSRLGYGKFREEKVRVVTDKIDQYGQSVPDPNGAPVNYFYLDEEQRHQLVESVLGRLNLV